MIFPSSLIIGPDSNMVDSILNRLDQHLTPNNPDILNITEYSIEKIREIQNFLSLAPYSHQNKVVIIKNIDKLQNEAQNALLKILEEPGENNYFILTTSQVGKVNPTIISRCHQILIKSSNPIPTPKLIFGQNIKDSLLQSENLVTDKSEFLAFLQNEQTAFHYLLTQKPDLKIKNELDKINTGIAMFHANIDPKSILDFILLSPHYSLTP